MPGIPLSALPASLAAEGLRAGMSLLLSLHEIPTDTCPFDARLAVAIPRARGNVAAGLVDEDDFDAVRRGASAESLLDGDACLPNLRVDPDTLRPTGIIDVGRLGVADRHQDLALLTRSAGDAVLNPVFASLGIDAPMDPWRLEFYRLLDEFS